MVTVFESMIMRQQFIASTQQAQKNQNQNQSTQNKPSTTQYSNKVYSSEPVPKSPQLSADRQAAIKQQGDRYRAEQAQKNKEFAEEYKRRREGNFSEPPQPVKQSMWQKVKSSFIKKNNI